MEKQKLLKSTNSPESFLTIIPNSIPENLSFRKKLFETLIQDKEMLKVFLQMCLERPQIAFKSLFWTFNPRMRAGYRNLPFITRPAQDEAIDAVKDAIDNGHDLLIDKSRDEGATEIIVKMYCLYWLLVPDSMFLVGSRKEEFVDKTGDHKCLFGKLIYTIKNLPEFLVPNYEKTHMHCANLENGSVVDGESTNENFGAGDRRLSVLVDEHGRIQHSYAQSIIENLSDTTDCAIFNSTHFYGAGHPYNKLRVRGLAKGSPRVIVLPWERNPVKNKGLYRSSDLNYIEIKDIDYYREKYPKCFDNIEPMRPFKLSDFEVELLSRGLSPDVKFIADGGESNDDGWRSIWYDKEMEERDPRDMAQNVDRNPIGSGDMFFDPQVTKRIRDTHIRPPDHKGEIEFITDKNGKIRHSFFLPEGGRRRFKWWGRLMSQGGNLRPNQGHNYIVACDISMGTGSSNSVAGVYDVNTREKVGIFVCPNTPPESFADQVMAICNWAGGATKPYLIWEANGPGGSFDKRIRWHGYNFIYAKTDERVRHRPHSDRNGWYSGRDTKYDLLLELRIALAEGLRTNAKHKSLIVHDEPSVGEYEDYIYYESGEIGLSECIDEDSGARASHGDRVIPDGLYILALSEQPKAAVKEKAKAHPGSFAWRQQESKRRRRKKKQQWHD